MNNVNLVWFQTTKGHFGRDDLYLKTLNNLKKNIDLNYFNNKFLSLKVFNDDSPKNILKNFEGFHHLLWIKNDKRINSSSSYNDYSYYLLTNYLSDIINCYLEIGSGKYSKYTYLVEDDSPEIILQNNLQFYIEKAIEKLESDDSIFSVHLQRAGVFKDDYNSLMKNFNEIDMFVGDKYDYNFQNQIFRTDDMINIAKIAAINFDKIKNLHTEQAISLCIDNFSKTTNRNLKFISFSPRFCHSIHIGTPDSEKWINSYNL